jgi:hypothetical protein
MYNRIQGHIRVDQDLKALKGEKTKVKKKDNDKEKTRDQHEKDKQGKDKKRDFARYTFHTPTTAPPTQVMAVMQHRQILPPAPKLSTKSYRHNTGLWCHYHRTNGHDTDKCFNLKDAIEDAIQAGHLQEFVPLEYRQSTSRGRPRTPPRERSPEDILLHGNLHIVPRDE